MRITKFEQSCLLVEEGDSKLLIDPGTPFSNKHQISEMGILDAVLITHEHADHFDASLCNNIPTHTDVYVNESTSKQLSRQVKIVGDGEPINAGNFSIKVIELPHCLMPDGSEGPQNVGFLINDKLFHPGDGIELEGLSVENLALPINGPDVSMKRAFQFARQVSAKQAIAIHYDVFGANADLYEEFAKRFKQPFSLRVLDAGQSIDI